MGDEGRIPPHLDGVGAKLTREWLARTLADGAKERPYMLARMPKFGTENVGPLAAAFESADPIEPFPPVEFDEPERAGQVRGAVPGRRPGVQLHQVPHIQRCQDDRHPVH